MHRRFTLYIALLFFSLSFAQQGINYKAVIKDNNGNVIANQEVTVRFLIKHDADPKYSEQHETYTDANGMVVLNIGEGVPMFQTFQAIDWSVPNLTLTVAIDSGNGLVDMGTTQFMSVPYALNVSGLEAIDEGNGIGWRLKGRNPQNYGDIGKDAVDLSYSDSSSGATGRLSTAIGNNTTASGISALAIGEETTASGLTSIAMGYSTTASGNDSAAIGSYTTASGNGATAMGYSTTASGYSSTAMGYSTTASSYISLAIGRYNVGGGNLTAWVETDPLLEVGNGTYNTKSNALTILKNGTITAPSFDITEITDAKALITKEYADLNLASSGLEALNEGNGIGWRLKGRDPQNYGNIGQHAVDLSYNTTISETRGATGYSSISMGYNTTASGDNSIAIGSSAAASGLSSTALGSNTTASGTTSTAMGFSARASGETSTAMGNTTKASGANSTAMGYDTKASGDYSTAIGRITIASSYGSLAIGRYNLGGGNATSWVPTDRLFEIGNGTGTNNKSNAFTVFKNGNATLAGTLTQNSDRRLKKDISPLPYGLETVLALNPVAYNWKKNTQTHKTLGLIAQEIQPIINEIVHIADDAEETLSISYTELIPVLIKAIQEQQEIIDNQNSKINDMSVELDNMKTLDQRVNQLEALLNTTKL